MSHAKVTKEIAAPIETVFALFTDLERVSQHVSAIQSVEVLTDQPFGVGTRWRETRVMFGREASEVMEITSFEPNQRYLAEATSHGSHYVTAWLFEPANDGTMVTMEFTAIPISRVAKLMTPLSGMMMRSVVRMLNEDLNDVAKAAEAAARS